MKKSELREMIREVIVENKTIKHKTSWGTIHLEIEEDAGGAFIDLIVNKQEVLEINIQNPTGEVTIKQKKKKIKLK